MLSMPVLGAKKFIGVLALCGVLVAGVNVFYGPAVAADQDSKPLRILALGDSLTAGYGLDDPNDAFQVQLEQALKAEGYDVTVLPGGVSGDTTAGGLARLDWSLADNPDGVIIALGGNDLLRGIDPGVSKKNLSQMIETLQGQGIPVLLAGMRTIGNWGRDYEAEFNGMYGELAKEHDTLLMPFFLEDVAAVPSLNQDDGIHPTEEGVGIMVKNILPFAEQLVERIQKGLQS